MQACQLLTEETHDDEMITRTLPHELMDGIWRQERAYPLTVDIHDLPFTKCNWATERVLIIVSFSFSETGRGIVSDVGLDVWGKIESVMK